MARTIFFILFIISFFIGCKSDQKTSTEKGYLRWVGDINFDSSLDDTEFTICNSQDSIIQYFSTRKGAQYVGEKSSVIQHFKTNYEPIKGKNQNGLIRIRFIVNCEGRAGRFRVLQADANFKETKFDDKITTQLLDLTKAIEEWVVLHHDDKVFDYYYYLIFKIVDGQITEILP
ncbi:MAG: hypothetical protein AAGA77_21590 [Bacteroidota bacterium]